MDSKTREFYPGSGVPFITTSAHSDVAPVHYFDMPREEYCAGMLTGMQGVYRLMFAIEKSPLINITGRSDEDEEGLFRSVVEDAISVLGEGVDEEIGRRGAAVGFLTSMSRMLRDHAKGKSWRESMMDEIADANTFALSEYESVVMRNTDLIDAVSTVAERQMQKTRKASRAPTKITRTAGVTA